MNETVRQEVIKRLGDYWNQTSRMGEVDIDLLFYAKDLGFSVRKSIARFSVARLEMLGYIGDVKALLEG